MEDNNRDTLLHQKGLDLWHKMNNQEAAIRCGQCLMTLHSHYQFNIHNMHYYSVELPHTIIRQLKELNEDNQPTFEEGYKPTNSSLSVVGDHIFVLQRTVNYIVADGDYHPGADGTYTSTIWLLVLNNQLQLQSQHRLLNQDIRGRVQHYDYVGYEDPRILPTPISVSDDQIVWKFLCNRYIGSLGSVKIVQHIGTLTFDWKTAEITSCVSIDQWQHIEKNWIPIHYRPGLLTAIYNIHPYTLLTVNDDGDIIQQSRSISENVTVDRRFDLPMSGGCTFKIDDRLFYIGHHVGRRGGRRHYVNRFAELTPCGIIAVTPYFNLNREHYIEYIMGACYYDGYILVSVGVGDTNNLLIRVSVDWLLSNLLTIDMWEKESRHILQL